MKNIIEAINELVRGANIAQARGTYSLKEAHDIFAAVEFINAAIANQQAAAAAPEPEVKSE